ncbi:hypothetical protein [Piscinibacter sp.]|uniref:hypothetical protein n=1 Tax=Piscinibacter sp. TaxID=1903157 RepID=UPI002C1B637E|nr:hypothetical protein [Albitalea sp.]HUG24119.1 hypothetical protein [Albitalea sp.]
MNPGPLTFALALVLAGAPFPAAAEIVDLEWDATGRAERKFDVAPGKFVELCGKLPAGAKVQWQFEAAAPLNFNVHYHVGKEVRYPARSDQVSVSSGELDASVEQGYCWMWTNKTASPVALSVLLRRGS